MKASYFKGILKRKKKIVGTDLFLMTAE